MLCIQYQVKRWAMSTYGLSMRRAPTFTKRLRTTAPLILLYQGANVEGIGLAWLVHDGHATQPESRRFPGRLKRLLMQRWRLWLACLNTIGYLLGSSPLRQAGSSVSSLGWPNIEHQTRPFSLFCFPTSPVPGYPAFRHIYPFSASQDGHLRQRFLHHT
ncbi:uncharacterized protein B0T23DRAFT_142646 [Neurospora hispaniola]|uniref:Uncharacterized protein n=1 Tax=Neurospora hispaniola TaxID=588809 RepID=A0AAJ0I7P1_9PEZI|nr:hypothetical protein B0T23DRAFT_142646 [Neurospora hispaniola]